MSTWVVRLWDVHPDCASRILAEGIQRARYRDSFEREELLVPGEIHRFKDILIMPFVEAFLQRHEAK